LNSCDLSTSIDLCRSPLVFTVLSKHSNCLVFRPESTIMLYINCRHRRLHHQLGTRYSHPKQVLLVLHHFHFLYHHRLQQVAKHWIDRKSTRLNSSHVSISYAPTSVLFPYTTLFRSYCFIQTLELSGVSP